MEFADLVKFLGHRFVHGLRFVLNPDYISLEENFVTLKRKLIHIVDKIEVIQDEEKFAGHFCEGLIVLSSLDGFFHLNLTGGDLLSDFLDLLFVGLKILN